MEPKLRPVIVTASACILALVACAPAAAPIEVPAPAATVTAQAFDCAVNFTYDKLKTCSTEKDERIADLDKIQNIVNSSFVDAKYRPMYLKTIDTMKIILADEKTLKPNTRVGFFEYKREGTFGKTFPGCSKTIPFDVDLVLPNNNNDQDDILGTKWHEYEHVRRSYERYQNKAECPYGLSDDEKDKEEVEVDYWGRYLRGAARRFGYTSQSKDKDIKESGRDLADIVYVILAPKNIGPDNWLFDSILTPLMDRYIFVSIIGKDFIPLTSQETQDKIKQVETDWKAHLTNATPQEKEAIKQMVSLKLVAPDFFPSLP